MDHLCRSTQKTNRAARSERRALSGDWQLTTPHSHSQSLADALRRCPPTNWLLCLGGILPLRLIFATEKDCFSLSCRILISFLKKLPLDLWIDRSFRKPSHTDAGWRRPHQQTKLAFGACVFPLIWFDNPNPWNLYVSDSQAETHVHIYPQFSSKVKQNHQTKDDHRKLKDSSPPETGSSWWNVFFFSHGIMLDFRHQKSLGPKQLQLKFNPLWLVKISHSGRASPGQPAESSGGFAASMLPERAFSLFWNNLGATAGFALHCLDCHSPRLHWLLTCHNICAYICSGSPGSQAPL